MKNKDCTIGQRLRKDFNLKRKESVREKYRFEIEVKLLNLKKIKTYSREQEETIFILLKKYIEN